MTARVPVDLVPSLLGVPPAATGSQDYCAQCVGAYEHPEASPRVTQDERDAFTAHDFAALDGAAGATLWRDS